jgi:hypothetical protein
VSLPPPEVVPPKLSPEYQRLGTNWSCVVREGRVIKAKALPSQTCTFLDPGKCCGQQAVRVDNHCEGARTKEPVV